jgi:hypothetical protein
LLPCFSARFKSLPWYARRSCGTWGERVERGGGGVSIRIHAYCKGLASKVKAEVWGEVSHVVVMNVFGENSREAEGHGEELGWPRGLQRGLTSSRSEEVCIS